MKKKKKKGLIYFVLDGNLKLKNLDQAYNL